MLVGNPAEFAIESEITEAYRSLGQRALGFFVIHLEGKVYGVREPRATLLACSYDTVCRRVARRGQHQMPLVAGAKADAIVEAFRVLRYDEQPSKRNFFGITASEVQNIFTLNEIMWVPDGDEAFDDGSHILQFDEGDKVRLIAFLNTENPTELMGSIVEKWIYPDVYYGILSQWLSLFEVKRQAALTHTKP